MKNRVIALLLFCASLSAFAQKPNLPDGTTASGDIIFTNRSAPSTPASGKTATWTDSTSKLFCAINDAGTLSCTVIARTAPAGEFFNSLSSSGVLGSAVPSFSGLSGSVGCSQMPGLTDGATSSSGSCATSLTLKINGSLISGTHINL